MAKKKLQKLGQAIFGTSPAALELPGEANVNDESEGAGVAFGQLMKSVGLAVAETQMQLNLTAADMANLLSNTPVDVIIAEEELFDDNGTLIGATSYKSSLPLINFVDPVFYEWPNVRLQGVFVAEEFTAASATNITQVSATLGASAGSAGKKFALKRKAPTIRVDVGASNTNITSQFASDRSYGRMRMNAMLTPRNDVVIPKPRVVTAGPRLEFFQKEIEPNSAAPERTAQLIVQYTKLDEQNKRAAINGRPISIDTGGVDFKLVQSDFVTPLVDLETDTEGKLYLVLKRTFATQDDANTRPAIPVTISARIGFVTASTTVVF
jgi:hypothetical protein